LGSRSFGGLPLGPYQSRYEEPHENTGDDRGADEKPAFDGVRHG
jgi:hypothetical protein